VIELDASYQYLSTRYLVASAEEMKAGQVEAWLSIEMKGGKTSLYGDVSPGTKYRILSAPPLQL